MRKLSFNLILLLSGFICLLLSSEIFLRLMDETTSRSEQRQVNYSTQFLHPYYYFFFPQSSELIKMVNNEEKAPWIDKRGYGGGVGPEKKGERKLAFLIGGSTAFGDGASNSTQTISAHLNRIQKKYFFVNAGVPSWNSFQELLRLLKQIIPTHPQLVVSLTGVNDILNAYYRRDLDIPVDSPESFEDLFSWVEDIRSNKFKSRALFAYLEHESFLGVFLFTRLREKIFGDRKYRHRELSEISVENKGRRSLQELSSQLVTKIFQNTELMYKICKINDVTFHSIIQPYRPLHPYFFDKSNELALLYKQVGLTLMNKKEQYIHDLSIPFSNYTEKKINELYIDDYHFNDEGYYQIALMITSFLNLD